MAMEEDLLPPSQYKVSFWVIENTFQSIIRVWKPNFKYYIPFMPTDHSKSYFLAPLCNI